MPYDALLALAYFALVFPACYLLGSWFRPFLKLSEPKMAGVVYFGLGLGLLAYFVVVAGHANALQRPVLFAFLAVLYAFRWKSLGDFTAWISEIWFFLTRGQGKSYRFFWAAFLLTALFTLALCFVPETANDSLCYQLNLPKVFASHHSTRPLFYDLNSQMPFLMQHLYAAALVLGSASLAKIFHWATGVFLFLAVFLAIFQSTQRKLPALFFALMLWLTPACINEVTSAYVDVAVAFFLFMAVWMFREGLRTRAASLFFAGGLFLGFVVSTKLIALLWVGAFAFVLLGVLFVSFRKLPLVKMLGVGLLGGVLGCGFWFVRNWIIENNPVFPYLESVFTGPSLGLVGSYTRVGLPKTLGSFLLLPWNITFLPEVFDRGFWVGPFYLLSLPFALWGAWKRREARFWLAFVFCSLVLWFFVVQNSRFLFPVLPAYLLCVGMGYAAVPVFKSGVTRWLRIPAAGLVVFFLLLTGFHYRYPARVLGGLWTPSEYLEKMERSYPVAEWVNRHLPPDASIFNFEEVRQYYFRRDMVREIWFRARTHYDQKVAPDRWLNYLREKGFTHVLRVYCPESPLAESDRVREDALDRVLQDPAQATRLVSLESKNIKEAREHYDVYVLTASPAQGGKG